VVSLPARFLRNSNLPDPSTHPPFPCAHFFENYSENQATGLERFELLGKLDGVDVFDMKPLKVERLGTMKEPISVYSLVSGCLCGFSRVEVEVPSRMKVDEVAARLGNRLQRKRKSSCSVLENRCDCRLDSVVRANCSR
jgi:hypothetical protein